MQKEEGNSCLSISAHLDTNQFKRQTSSIQKLHMLQKRCICQLNCLTAQLAGCFLFYVFLTTKQESVTSHLFLSILGFATYHQTCTGTFESGQLVAGREELDFTEEVCAQMLWKRSRGGQPDPRWEHREKGSSYYLREQTLYGAAGPGSEELRVLLPD